MPSFRTVVSVVMLVVVMSACAGEPAPAEGTSSQDLAATITSITVTPATAAIPVGVQQQLKATAIYSNNTKKALSTGVSWSVNDPSVASVDSTGLVTALHAGVVAVTVHQLASGVSGVATVTVTSATLASIAISPAKRVINVGVVFTFKATGKFSDGTKFRLTSGVAWGSNQAIATIDGSGTTTGISAGTTAVTASAGGLTAKAVLTVGTATLTSIAVTPATASLPIGATQAFVATGTYSDNTTMDLTSVATWTSAKPAFATMSTDPDAPGIVTGVAIGKSTITAKVAGLKGTAVVTVKAVTLASIAVTPAIVSLPDGTTQQLRATGMYSDHTTRDLTAVVTWSSSSPAVGVSNASGTEGLATAMAIGPATITAVEPTTNLSATSAVTVTAAVLQSIAVTPPAASVALGYTQPYVAIGAYSDGTHRDLTTAVTWSANPPAVAAISNDADSAGLATSLAIGSTTVTAVDPATGITGTAQLAITPATLSSLAITPTATTIPNGFAQPFTATGTYSDHTVQDLTAIVTWSVPVGAATISNVPGSAGVASSGGVGASTISAVDPASGRTATASLQVTAAVVVALAISPQAPTIEVRQSQQLTALATFSDHTTSDLTAEVTWIPSNADVAVSNADGSRGLATGLVEGSATITAIDPTTGVSATDSIAIDDRCSPNPCEQGGVCVDGPSSYTCTCPIGTAGANCEATIVTLEKTIRDFHNSASDFNALLLDCASHTCGDARLVLPLGLDLKPQSYGEGETNVTTFDELWNDTPGVNLSRSATLTLSNAGQADPSVFAFGNAAFYPIDGQLFGNEGGAHNDFFTVEAHATLVYAAGTSLSFAGPVAPDNLWVYVNRELVVTRSGTVNLDAIAAAVHLAPGDTLPLEIFYAHAGGPAPALTFQISRPTCSSESAMSVPVDPATVMRFGSATSTASTIQLIPPTVASSAGAAWRPAPMLPIGFRTNFQFRVTHPNNSPTPEGFAFVVTTAPGVGASGGNLGYAGLGPSIAIELDTAAEPQFSDPGFAQISIHSRGASPNDANEGLASIGASGFDPLLNLAFIASGQWISGAIEFEPVPSQQFTWIRVYLDQGVDRIGDPEDPAVPVARAEVPDAMLAGALGSGAFYMGFTAASGANNANEVDIANWTVAATDCRQGLSCASLSPLFTTMTTPAPVQLPQPGAFVIQARDTVGSDLSFGGAAACFAVTVTNGSTQAPTTITDNLDGTYNVSFAPNAPGTWETFVRLQGIDLDGSPAAVSVLAP